MYILKYVQLLVLFHYLSPDDAAVDFTCTDIISMTTASQPDDLVGYVICKLSVREVG